MGNSIAMKILPDHSFNSEVLSIKEHRPVFLSGEMIQVNEMEIH